jgi:hypothetical protein
VRRALLVTLVLVGGCRFRFDDRADGDGGNDGVMVDVQPPASLVPNWTSGTRIRAIVASAVDGGDRFWFNWRDTQLDTDCYAGTAGDGAERCLPIFADASTFYSDAGCTQPLVYVRNNLCNRDIKYGQAIIASRYHIYPVGAPYTGQAYDIRTGCMPASGVSALYQAGAEVSPAIFETVSYTSQMVGGFSRTYQGYADGAALEIGNLNFNIGSCYPSPGHLGTSQCRPQFVATAVYTDAGCTQRAYLYELDVSYFGVLDPGVCSDSYTLYKKTADVTQPNYWEQTPSGCQMQTTPLSTYLLAGLPTTNPYPTGTIVPGPDRGRLGTLYWIGPDGSAMILATWDQQQHRPCRPFVADDGKMRCLPTRSPRVDAYPNATCSSATKTLTVECYPDIMPVDGPTYSSCEDQAWTVENLAKTTDTPSVANEATCVPQSTPAYDPTVSAGTLPASMFPELTFTVE